MATHCVVIFLFLYGFVDALSFLLSNNSIDDIVKQPTYCIQPDVLSIFGRRFSCLAQGSAQEELLKLQYESTSEYLRSHELLAFQFFTQTPNPFRRPCSEAEFEYIPFLPLHWIATSPSAAPHCTYSALIEDIVRYIQWLKQAQDLSTIQSSVRPRFSIASTFNMRTAMGTGMPTPHRKGDVYDMITLFVTTTSIGHYERWPQCPDLLRKSWKYVMELPYLPLHHHHTILQSLDVVDSQSLRLNKFLFVGRMLLWGPERVCSVRNAISSIADLPGVTVVEVPESISIQAPNPKIFKLLSSSVFCFIAKADSYSTATLYSAIHAGCIPVVISDWFVFAFPWAIPYKEFVIRVLEDDFLKNPSQVVDFIVKNYYDTGKYKVLQEAMLKWTPLLSFEFVNINSPKYPQARSLLFHSIPSQSAVVKALPAIASNKPDYVFSADAKFTVLPFEMMLLELRYAQRPELMHKSVPCAGPFKCTEDGSTLNDVALHFKQGKFNKLTENRSHLCKHVSRLIGHYKIVYYMQCVRILWPLTPGKLIKADLPSTSTFSKTDIVLGSEGIRDATLKRQQLDKEDLAFVMNFHALTNISKSGSWKWTTYPKFEQENYVKQLENIL